MLFNSFEFLLFFPVVTILYFLLPYNYRWFLLLSASCFFYMFFKPEYILILGFTIVVDYFAGILLENEKRAERKKIYLIMSLVANIGVLAIFKYYNFINENITGIANLFGVKNQIPYLHIILPIGLSFHTFQAMSYTIEVYRGNQKAERNFGIYSLYVMFYPQLVAGPIERPQNLIHQFYEKHDLNVENFRIGARLILWGLFKKAVIADRLSLFVDPVYNNPADYSATGIAIATIFFSFQIFCDFSGYSDIAIGAARIIGFKLMTNFNKPYHSLSVGEFWKRWHISLSTWFKDYLYISMGGNRVSAIRRNMNLCIVFLVSGFWHGANWTFIIWGALHGCYVVLENTFSGIRSKIASKIGLSKGHWLNSLLNRLVCFILVAFAWIFFRANNVKDAFYIVRKLGLEYKELFMAAQNYRYAKSLITGNINPIEILYCFLLIIILEAIHFFIKEDNFGYFLEKMNETKRWVICIALFAFIYLAGVFDNHQFIYFQF